MARFRNSLTGVVVDVDEDTADRLGAVYEKVDVKKPAPKRRTSKPDDD